MGRYIDFEYLLGKYPKATTVGGADEVNSHYIVPAEFELDSMLGAHFTVPFSSNNVTVKDLTRDLSWYRMNVHRDKNAKSLKMDIDARVKALNDGVSVMISEDGTSIATIGDAVWGETQDYHSSFGMDSPGDWQVSSAWQQSYVDDRL